ncbi:membrane protein [Paenibacillus sp. J31TS4]|uniref:MMPL family transporter n=1 Tax=Paenibacillus sp. J31TS4 TaxID=2807195 RepID=UPI001B041813|nr:MMPL family transporter [Paenibacillus sp. J31TS4]GIP39305.1 membrane protein [Paenibacillus sp. J31TS4]
MNKSFAERFGGWVAGPRTRWVTLVVWIVLAALLSLVFPSISGEEDNGAPNLSDDRPSVKAERLANEQFPNETGIPALIVWNRSGGLSDADLQQLQKLTEKLTAEPLPEQSFVPPYHKMPLPALKGQLSEDRTTLVLPIFFAKGTDAEHLKESVTKLAEEAKAVAGADPFQAASQSAELNARVTGPVGISIDATALFSSADFTLLIATVLLVLILLLLIYRSPILALIPIIAVGFAYLVVSPILGFMAHQGWITADGQSISIMTVLLFGAGTDYCLFLIARFRQLLAVERDKRQALFAAIKDASGAVAMSGFTVVLSLLALLAARYGQFVRFAVPFSLSILVMFVASLTLVPALLAIIGRASFFPFIPRTPEMERERAQRKGKPLPQPKKGGRFSKGIGHLVVQRPWLIALLSVVLLGGLAAVSPQIKYTSDILSSFPGDMPSREGFATIADTFSPGELAPAKIMIETENRTVPLGDTLKSLSYLAHVGEPVKGQTNGAIVAYDVQFAMNPYSNEAMDRIPELQAAAEEALAKAGVQNPADKVHISGQTATQYDAKQVTTRDTRIIIPLVIALIAILLLVYLRSIVATAYLIGTVILSYFSALGLGWLILHYGLGTEAIQDVIPLYAFVFLVALGEDYNIFMVSSIWQKSRTMPLKQAIQEGVSQTSAVITSAGLILAGTFAVLASLPIQVLLQFGIITALGVLLDTFLVRPFLVPAITVLLGRLAFWPGRRSGLPEETTAGQRSV